MDEPIEQFRADLEHDLLPYGQYVSLRDIEEGSQPFTGAEIAAVALGMAAWAAMKRLEGYLGELGRQDAARRDDAKRSNAEALVTDLHALVDDAILERVPRGELEARWAALLDRLPQDTERQPPDRDELEALLRKAGLPRRPARRAAAQIEARMSERGV